MSRCSVRKSWSESWTSSPSECPERSGSALARGFSYRQVERTETVREERLGESRLQHLINGSLEDAKRDKLFTQDLVAEKMQVVPMRAGLADRFRRLSHGINQRVLDAGEDLPFAS